MYIKKFGLVLFGFALGVAVMFPFVPEISFESHTVDRDLPAASSSTESVLGGVPYIVVHVVDGDTIDVQLPGGGKERVRFIGIDTPETVDPRKSVQCYGKEASARMTELLSEKMVTLTSKPDEDKDEYGRLLRYVFLNGQDVGAMMLGEGYAESLCKKFPHPKCDLYEELQQKAIMMHLGRWSACTK